MEFTELVDSLKVIAPSCLVLTSTNATYKALFFEFTDSTGDKLLVEVELGNKPGQEILVGQSKGDIWIFPPSLCMWLAMAADLIIAYRSN
jgi:hypothetical protein